MKKSKFEYEMDEFNTGFDSMKACRMVIYGTGRMTATLIERNDRYNIIGLCDRDPEMIGTLVYGVPVVSQDFVERNADLVVINTASSYWGAIYKRIHDWNVPIYFRDGSVAALQSGADSNYFYWNTSIDELKRQINGANVVSFDIFDTLIMRKLMAPTDVYELVGLSLAKTLGIKSEVFVDARKKAAAVNDNPTFDYIYNEIGNILGWNQEEISIAKRTEISIEKELIVPRQDMVALFNDTIQQKEVYLISDMYYGSDVIKDFVQSCGLKTDNTALFVSCELQKDKISGSMWEWYSENIVKGRKALHIGDNKQSDCIVPQEYGINTYHILNSYDMLNKSSLSDIIEDVSSIFSSVALGIICSKIFNSPYALNDSRGVVRFSSDEDAGFCIYGAFAYSFLNWLVCRAEKDEIDKLAFLARDGYLLQKQYKKLVECIGVDAPKSIYVEVSRRVICAANINSMEDLMKIASYPYKGNAKEYLLDRFGADINDISLSKHDMTEIQNDSNRLRELIEKYSVILFERCKEEKNNYMLYLRDLEIDSKTALVDSLLYGTIQYHMGHILGHPLVGYYMCCKLDEDNEYIPYNTMYGCFQEPDDLSADDCAVKAYGDYVESFYTAPNGMTMYINSEGHPVYGQKMSNQKFFDVRVEMNKGVELFIESITDLINKVGIDFYSFNDTLFVDKFLRCCAKNGFEPTENMKKGFFYDNGFANRLESPIWL